MMKLFLFPVLRGLLGVLSAAVFLLPGPAPVSADESTASREILESATDARHENFKWLTGALDGFSATQIYEHLALLDQYRRKLSIIEDGESKIDLALADPLYSRWRSHVLTWNELHNAVRLHEYFFEALTPKRSEPGKRIVDAIEKTFGSFDQWWIKFRATALSVRGWAALAWDRQNRRLKNVGLDRDCSWPVGLEPLLVVDMAEHAYVLDFPGRPLAYLNAWFARVDWSVVETRLKSASGEK